MQNMNPGLDSAVSPLSKTHLGKINIKNLLKSNFPAAIFEIFLFFQSLQLQQKEEKKLFFKQERTRDRRLRARTGHRLYGTENLPFSTIFWRF